MMRTSTGAGGPRAASPRRSCEHAQELGLHRRVHLADLIEEQRAAVGLAEAPGRGGDGAGEGAADVAEELAFQQARRGWRRN